MILFSKGDAYMQHLALALIKVSCIPRLPQATINSYLT